MWRKSVGSPDVREHKFRGGGWSHLRFQHVAENAWMRNAGSGRRGRAPCPQRCRNDRLAGDPRSRSQVVETLGDVRAGVVQLESGGRAVDGEDEALFQEVNGVLAATSRPPSWPMCTRFGIGSARASHVAIGIADVIDALIRGQVDLAHRRGPVPGVQRRTAAPSSLSFGAVKDLPDRYAPIWP